MGSKTGYRGDYPRHPHLLLAQHGTRLQYNTLRLHQHRNRTHLVLQPDLIRQDFPDMFATQQRWHAFTHKDALTPDRHTGESLDPHLQEELVPPEFLHDS